MTDLALPSKPQIEKLVLGEILVEGDRFGAIRQSITRDAFTCEKHRVLFDACERLYQAGCGIDRMTAHSMLQDIAPGKWTLTELHALDDDTPAIPQIDGYLDTLNDVADRRKAMQDLSGLIRELAEGGDTRAAKAKAARIAHELAGDGRSGGLLSVSEIVGRAGGIDRMMAPHTFSPAAPMPWSKVCQIFGGLGPGRVTILAARPGDGKTTFALQALHHAATLGTPAVLFSLEMGGDEILHRLACLLAGVNLQKFLRGCCSRDEERSIVQTLGSLASLPLRIDDSNCCTVGAIRRALSRAGQTPRIVVIDYLQLLDTAGRTRQRYEALGEITRGLKILAREMEVSILCLSQLTRANEHEKRAPELRDLRESGSIEQDADNVLMLHHMLSEADGRNRNHGVKVLVRKQRLGPLGEVTLEWNATVARFDDPTDHTQTGQAVLLHNDA